ncbi:hypothetical protein [Mucilaginibacter antarcticus]|uniref:Uncharacterized protein n=1 Tax=Mucilaginibacter antarcticus TaxID=1855725 RepID=A0ABW5XRV8_9SPHI
METAIHTHSLQLGSNATHRNPAHLWNKILANVDAQADSITAWFLVSLVFQGVLFLPIPAVLMYYYHAPIIVLPITLGLYLANIIAGMGGSGIRTIAGLIVFSVVANLIMLAIFIL